MAKRTVVGWLVDEGQKAELLERFPPAYPDVVAHHITLSVGIDEPLPPPARAEIVGIADDGDGVQAMVVKLDGTTHRPDGSTYHITWSLDPAKKRHAVESNKVIAERGWTALPAPIPVTVTPGRWDLS
jgi:hypothetical protein